MRRDAKAVGRERRWTATLVLLLTMTFVSCNSGEVGREPASSPATSAGNDEVLSNSAQVLDEIAKSESSGIPDAVLNRTRCIVVIPAKSTRGMMSCHEGLNDWSRPMLVVHKGQQRKAGSDLVVLLLQPEAVKGALGQGLRIGAQSSSSPGPLVRSKALVTDADLNFASLVYERVNGALVGSSSAGTVAAESGANEQKAKLSGSEARVRSSVISFFNTIIPSGIIFHHTAVLPELNKVPEDKKEIDEYHRERGMDVICFGREYHVAYHYLVTAKGEVQAGRPERCQGAHAMGYNSWIGISVAGDFSREDNPDGKKGLKEPTPKQVEAVVQLTRQLMKRYKIPMQRVMRHSDVSATRCPGDRFPFRRVLEMASK